MRSGPVAAGMLLLALALANGGEPAVDGARIARLIGQLGSESFLEREEARKELETIGPPALVALHKAARTGDLETARRAAELVRVIEQRALTAALLAPKKVHLKLQDVPVLQAVEALARQSGYTVRVDGDRTLLTGRMVTLDTGMVTFWEALDQLGARAGLVEKFTVAGIPGDPNLAMNTFIPLDIEFGSGLRRPRKGPPPLPPLRAVPLPPRDAAPPRGEPATPDDGTPAETQVVPGMVILMPGQVSPHASYAGAARMLLRAPKRPASTKGPADKVYDLVLEASAEPRVLGFGIAGVPAVTRAVDEHGQALAFVIDPQSTAAAPTRPAGPGEPVEFDERGNIVRRRPMTASGVTVRLRQGPKPARQLKELAGALTAHVLVAGATLATFDDVTKAKGKSVDVKGGGRVVLDTFEKLPKEQSPIDRYRIIYKVEGLPMGPSGPGTVNLVRGGKTTIVGTGPTGSEGRAALLDAKGKRLTVVGAPSFSQESDAQGQFVRMVGTIEFTRDAGQGEPARLLLTGTHLAPIMVPFHFTDVPLP